MPDDFEEEMPKKRKKGKPLLTGKRATILLVAIALIVLGALFQHFLVEPVLEEQNAVKYARCLTQKQVLDERFVQADSERRACEYQLAQCTAG